MSDREKRRRQAEEIRKMATDLVRDLADTDRFQTVPESHKDLLHQQITGLQKLLRQAHDSVESYTSKEEKRRQSADSSFSPDQALQSAVFLKADSVSAKPYEEIEELNLFRSKFEELYRLWSEFDYNIIDAYIDRFVKRDLMSQLISRKYEEDAGLVVSIFEDWHESINRHKLTHLSRNSSDSIDIRHLLKLTYSGHTQIEIADILGVAQPSIARRLMRAEEYMSYLIAAEKVDLMFVEEGIQLVSRLTGGVRAKFNGLKVNIEYVILGVESEAKKVGRLIKKAEKHQSDTSGTIYVFAFYLSQSRKLKFCLTGDLAQMNSWNRDLVNYYDLEESGIEWFSSLRELLNH